MIELHLVGYTAELGHLVLDLVGGDGGRYRVRVEEDLFATLDELRERRRDQGLPVGDLAEFADDLGLDRERLQQLQDADGRADAAAGRISTGAAAARSRLDEAPAAIEPPGEPDEARLTVAPVHDEAVHDRAVGDPVVFAARPPTAPDPEPRAGLAVSEPDADPGPETPPVPESPPEPSTLDGQLDPAPDPEPAPAPEAQPGPGTPEPCTAVEVRTPPRPLTAPPVDRGSNGRAREPRPAPESDPRPVPVLSPAEIQSRLRSGRSVRAVARAAGVDEERIRRWEVPIVAERARILDQARALRLERPRLGRSSQPLGEAVRRNLASRGVTRDDVAWETSRRRDGRWRVCVRYVSRGRKRSAAWTYDPDAGELRAASDTARELGFVRRRRR